MSIKKELQQIVYRSLNKINITIDIGQILIEVPKNKENGNFSTNIALLLCKKEKVSPIEIANDIVNNINSNIIEKIEIAPPGFINFYLKRDFFLDKINTILELKENYGKTKFGTGISVNIEYVSANPTGTLHVGHGRGAAYGDNLSRIMKFSGYDVTREYYINDAGNQINNLAISVKERYKQQCGLNYQIPENGYHGQEIIILAEKIYNEYKDSKLNSDLVFFKDESMSILLEQIKMDLDKFRVSFDIFTSEQSLYDNGTVEFVLNKLKQSNKCYISENALWLKTTSTGDDKDRVLIKNDGTYTYFLPDIAYHYDKYNRGYEMLIDVFGADHYGYINRLKGAMEMLSFDKNKLSIEILQMVRLLKDGEELKISKRTGKTITLNDLIDEIGINATRYFFASKSLDSQMDLDLNLAIKNTNDNPVYYIEYANARISSILNNYRNEITVDRYETLDNDIAYNMLIKMCEFEDVIISTSVKQAPHILTNYIYELATLFHSYYAQEKIITSDIKYTSERINLLRAVKITINNALNLIGIIPRDEM